MSYAGGSVPEWLAAALACEPRREAIATSVGHLHASVWDPTDGRDPAVNLMLLHGNAAHRGWWAGIAPSLRRDARVIALDLSGHGDSPRRDRYELGDWADEVFAVQDVLASDAPTILVGHSMGGLIALTAAWAQPGRFRGIITFDTPLRRYTAEQLEKRQSIASRPLKRYVSAASARAEFKTVPLTQDPPQPLMDHIAAESYRQDGGAWVLKLDPVIYARTTDVDSFLRPFPERTFCVRAAHGLIDDAMRDEISPHLEGSDHLVTVPDVGHNLILEAPQACAWMIVTLTARILATDTV